MIMAPITPVKDRDWGILGIKPNMIFPKGGDEYQKLMEKNTNMINTNTPKIDSKTF